MGDRGLGWQLASILVMGRVRMFNFIVIITAADLQNTQQSTAQATIFAADHAITSHSHDGSADACRLRTTQMQQSSED